MKRTLFAVFLAVMLVAAVVFITAPNAKAAGNMLTPADADKNGKITVTESGKILDLQGATLSVELAEDITLSVVDTANTKASGAAAGKLTVNAPERVNTVSQYPEVLNEEAADYHFSLMRYLKVENDGDDAGTYSFHPFNLTIVEYGINTKANGGPAISLRAAFMANNVVLKHLDDYGISSGVATYTVKQRYPFANNFVNAYADLIGSLDAEPKQGKTTANIDTTATYNAYMTFKFGEETYTINSTNEKEITPRNVLKKINKDTMDPTAAQLERIQALMSTNTRVNNILSRFRPETKSTTMDFSSTAQRVSQDTSAQIWKNGNITLSNLKGSATSNVVGDVGPVKFYSGSTLTIECTGMTKMVFNCNTAAYATDLAKSFDDSDISAAVNGKVVTVELSEATNAVTIKMSAQVRVDSLIVTAASHCTHEVHNAKCTESGLCLDCDEAVSAPGHTLGTPATCKDPAKCSVCGESIDDKIDENAHNYVDGICTICGGNEPTTDPDAPSWTKTDLANIKSTDIVVIVWTTSDGTSYAISNDKGTSSAPTAVKVTVDNNALTGDIADNIKWNIANSSGTLTIYPNGTTAKWLYCTSSNNGVRVGTNTNKTFTIDSSSGYLKHTGTSRYLGVYTANPDVRCYTNTTGNTANQTLAFYVYNSGTAGGETPDTPACKHTNTTTTTVAATCTAAGSKTVTCDDCGETVSTEEIAALGHTTENGVCGNCGETIGSTTPSEPKILATFALGANGSASHTDGTSKTSYSETNNGYTLSITGGTQFYTGARDAKGNSCVKFGSSKNPGSCTFTVPNDVTSVVIYVAQYKANTTKINVNGTNYTIETASDNGAYTAITVDTTSNKTINFKTVSGGIRAMVNTIEFIG